MNRDKFYLYINSVNHNFNINKSTHIILNNYLVKHLHSYTESIFEFIDCIYKNYKNYKNYPGFYKNRKEPTLCYYYIYYNLLKYYDFSLYKVFNTDYLSVNIFKLLQGSTIRPDNNIYLHQYTQLKAIITNLMFCENNFYTYVLEMLKLSNNSFYKSLIINFIIDSFLNTIFYNKYNNIYKKILFKLYYNNILTYNLDFYHSKWYHVEHIKQYLYKNPKKVHTILYDYFFYFLSNSVNKKLNFIDMTDFLIKTNIKNFTMYEKYFNNIKSYNKRKIFILLVVL